MPCPFALLLFVPALQPILRKAADGTMFRTIHTWAAKPHALKITLVFWIAATLMLQRLGQTAAGRLHTPDSRFGMTADEIEAWLGEIGSSGRDTYTTVTLFDLFVYIFAYGFLLLVATSRLLFCLGWSEGGQIFQFTLILPVLTMFFDAFETASFCWAAVVYPEPVPALIRPGLQYCNVIKWCFAGCSVLAVSTGLLLLAVKCRIPPIGGGRSPHRRG